MRRGLIVSCQALPDEPLYGDNTMRKMALAAQQGGAIGIRTNGVHDIRSIKQAVQIPVIGIIKITITGSPIFITPTLNEVKQIVDAGADIAAMDMTDRDGRMEQVKEMIRYAHDSGILVMADISTLDEAIKAENLGADLISTTLSGYTPYSPQTKEPDIELVRQLKKNVRVPIVAEGRIWTPQQALLAFDAGATYVVVGSAITRPQLVTRHFTSQISQWLKNEAASQL
jgi:N-acylglucosamine-6-phosphate 2-epimerase